MFGGEGDLAVVALDLACHHPCDTREHGGSQQPTKASRGATRDVPRSGPPDPLERGAPFEGRARSARGAVFDPPDQPAIGPLVARGRE
jgi:hypothetical protein